MLRPLLPLALVAVLGAGCDHGSSAPPHASAPPGARASSSSAIAIARRSPSASGLRGLFPHTPTRRHCVIPGGGPPPGLRIPGTCATVVRPRGSGTVVVRFVESWRAQAFRGPGAGARSRLSHTWEFVVATAPPGHVVRTRTYGDFPPQLVH